jgi:hypothetical protein
MAMTETDELSFVSIEGRTLPHSHAELVQTPRGWHVELDDVPPDSCPLVKQECEIALEAWDGDRYAGTVVADFVTEDGGYVLLTGIGALRLIASAGAA